MYTKSEIAEILTRPYNPPARIRKKMIEKMSNWSDKRILSESQKQGLKLTRLRDNQFILETLTHQ
jgi:hypothetical protein